VVPFRRDPKVANTTMSNPFPVPEPYAQAVEDNVRSVAEIRKKVKQANLGDPERHELQNCIQVHFKDWLASTGNLRQIYDLAMLEREADMQARAPSESSQETG